MLRKWLRKLREERGLTQQQMADKFCTTRQNYSAIEAGERQKNLDINIAQKLAEIFDVTLDYICEQENRIEK